MQRNNLYKHVKKVDGKLTDFHKKTGIEVSTATKLLYEPYRIPTIQNLKRICIAYPGFTPNDLLGYENWNVENKVNKKS